MTLAELADLGELLGGVAVIASLVYLALEIRQNTRSVRGATLHGNTDLWTALFVQLAQPDTAKAYVAGMAGEPEMRPLFFTQFFLICRAMFIAFENQYYQKRQGILDPATYAAYERSIRTQFLAFPGFRIWWELSRSVFSPAFVQHVDEMIATTPEASPDSLYRDWQRLARDHARPS